MKAPHRMAGFSLVELMVAMVLGLLITAAAVSLFSTNQRTFALQQAMSESQEQGQLALRFIGQDLQLTGYVSDQVSTLNYPGVNLETFLGMPASADSANGTNDRLTISHHGRADCTGTTLTPAVVTEVANTYWVDDDGNLKCRGNLSTDDVILLKDVRSFQVLYGIDQTVDAVAFASRYVKPDDVGGRPVVAVKMALLLEKPLPSMEGAEEEQTFYLLDHQETVNEGRSLRRQFQSTVAIRNYRWGEV
ncbi:PilW family protein [Alloalcanivorax profundimaris]|uniref:PilW family protein n=1 Tax=Alloalcanivorax profundimaris TaxID=2735259 RepID=UPI001887EADC|nr:PilW family protein [Alloalcanivorax profundimaris]MBF1801053.1 prepilin-type N-terminal cleavage/methylation domain-containing protein [Alloalcanivorax profundimaris]